MTAIPGPSGAEPGESRALAGYPVTPPALPRPVIFDQRWTDLTFIHWPVLPESVAGSYPPGTRPDVFADGMTYVGLVPFRMSSTKLGTALPIPYVGTFRRPMSGCTPLITPAGTGCFSGRWKQLD